MEVLIITFLILVLVIVITLYFLQHKEIRNITIQLNEINKNKANSKILLSSPSKQLEKLALEINKSLEEKQETEANYKKMDLELRQAIVNISHDLRTPLTSIMGYIQLVEDDTLPNDEKSQYISIIKRRSESLEVLISSFYDLSRLEVKEYSFEFTSLNIVNIFSDVIALFYNDFVNKKTDPIIKIDENIQLVIGDEDAVKRVISNLIQNMIRYGDKFISISLEQNEDFIVMTFTNDTLNEISAEDATRLFERSFTADSSRSGKSTGIGLAITKQLVEQMGHKICVELNDSMISIVIKWNNR